MEEWKECKLSDICDYGKDRIEVSSLDNSNYISTENMLPNRAGITTATTLPTGELTPSFEIDDTLVSNIRPYFKKIWKATFSGGCSADVLVFKAKENVSKEYLYYVLADDEFFKYSMTTSKGTKMPRGDKTSIMNYPVKLPPLPTQQKIAAILSSLDDKIELNNKINTNLEQQAQALFKNWFVDFEPFGGKMPEGWKEADIYSIANIIYGSPFASKLFNTEKNGKPIIRIRDLKDQHSDVYTPEEQDDAYLIQPKDIVVGMDGEFRPYIWGSEPGWLNQRVCVFENKRPKGKAFLYFSIKPLLDVVEKTQVATTVIHIGKKDFDKFQIILPTEDILDRFDELTDPILDQIVANRLENRRLAELRDALLPKLMNREIEV